MIRKLLVLLLCLTAATATAKKPKSSASKKAESSAEKPKESDYDKLFKEKHTVADGMFRLHDVKGKLYFEIPDSLFGREMLLGSTISEVSDNAAATTGSKSDYPLHVVFTRNDRSVQLRTVNCENITDETGASRALAEAVKQAKAVGRDFDSRGEYEFYTGTVLPKMARGEIVKCKQHPAFPLFPAGEYGTMKLRPIRYTADFRLTYADGTVEIVEIKSKFVRRMQRDYPVRRRVFLEQIARPAGWKFTEIITAEDKDDLKRWRELAKEG